MCIHLILLLNLLIKSIFICKFSMYFHIHNHVAVTLQLQSHVRLLVTPWTVACQAPLSSTVSQSLLKFMSIELVIQSNNLILCHPLLLLPSVFPASLASLVAQW